VSDLNMALLHQILKEFLKKGVKTPGPQTIPKLLNIRN